MITLSEDVARILLWVMFGLGIGVAVVGAIGVGEGSQGALIVSWICLGAWIAIATIILANILKA